ncbi:MAG: protein kinase [Bradymonadaceae bacterium]|nr:protein kinase [Lujinxingiaceae bacterium]
MAKKSTFYCSECDRTTVPVVEEGGSPRCPIDGSKLFTLPEGLSPGTVVDGRYTIVRPLGRGGMGVVFVADHQASGRQVALKLIGTLTDDALMVRRFFREAKASARIVHRNVVEVYDFGQTAEGRPFIAMEILKGEELAEILSREGALSAQRSAHIAAEICAALAATHAHKILHRDLKPANVMVHIENGVERIKVLDFGLAKAVKDETGELGTLTATGMMVGTPHYMSPEQFRCSEVGPAADLYAVGCLLYQMLTGRTPFEGNNVFGLMRAHSVEAPIAPRQAAPANAIPLELEALCMELLEKEVVNRLTDASVAHRRLREMAGTLSTDDGTATHEAGDTLPSDSSELASESLQAFEAKRFRPALVGREHTRKFLAGIMQQCLQTSRPAVIVLEGPGGVGKSKLLEWYQDRARREGFRVVQGLFSEGHLGPTAALKEVLEGLLGVVDESWDVIEPKLAALVWADGRPGLTENERARLRPFLRPAQSSVHDADHEGFGQDERESLYESLFRTLRLAAGDGPTLVIMDDLRDDRPFDTSFIERLGSQLAESEQPLLVAMSVRTERHGTADAAPHDGESMQTAVSSLAVTMREQYYRVELKALDAAELKALVEQAVPGIMASAVERVTKLAAGSPLFALQLLRTMVSAGSLRRTGERWELVGEPELPVNLDAVLAERLERLSNRPTEEALLVRVALIGSRVPIALIEDVLEREGNTALAAELDDLLDRLLDDGWLRNADSFKEDAVVFEHGFVHQALLHRYGATRAARKLHGLVAEALELHHASQLEPWAFEIAEHFIGARNEARALPHLMTAARAAERRYAMDAAIEVWLRARVTLERAGADQLTATTVHHGLVASLIYADRYDEAGQILDQLADEAETLELRGDLAHALAALQQAHIHYGQAIDQFDVLGREGRRMRVELKDAEIAVKLSDLVSAAKRAQTVLDFSRQRDDRRLIGAALNQLAMIAQYAGELQTSLGFVTEEEVVWREIGDEVALARCLYTRGTLFWHLSDYAPALRAFGEAIPLLERGGHRRGLGHCLRMAGVSAQQLERLDEALSYCRRARETFERIGDRRGLQRVALCLADVHSARGEHQDATEWADQGLALARKLDDAQAACASLVTLGETNLLCGTFSRAITFFEEALAMEAQLGAPGFRAAYTHEKLGEAFAHTTEPDRSREHFDKAIAIYEKIGNTLAAAKLKKRLDGIQC